MTNINGASHHSVEDILASIRTSIAEEAGPARFVAGEIQMPAASHIRRDAHIAEEAPEFELPAIFKPGHHASPEKSKLLGRLSDALKATAPAEQSRVRTVIPFDPSAAGRVMEPMATPQESYTPPSASRTSFTQQAQPQSPGRDIKREMPTFFDTRINKLGELTKQAYTPHQAEPVPQPAPAQHMPMHHQMHHQQTHQPQLQHQPMQHRQPPTLPHADFTHHATDAVDDAAAQLLRPMLRQWLQENMPKIVEKALLSEVQSEFPAKRR